MTGHSYVGGTTNVGGASGAKGLKTIVPSASLASMYDHQFQAGVPYNAQFLGPIEAYEQLALQADLPPQLSPITQASGNGGTGDSFGQHPQDTGCGLPNSAASAGPDQATGVYNPGFHGTRDHREGVERGLKPGDKLWVGQWDHGIGSAPTRRGMQWTYALHAWFDKHLGGRDVDTGPPLEVFLNNEADDKLAWVSQEEILAGTALPRTAPYTLHARGEEGLATLPGEPGEVSFAGDAQGYTTGDNEEAGGVAFETAPFERDTLFFGLPQLTLSASISVPQVHLIATLFAVGDDHRRRLTQCAINPLLRDGLEQAAPAVPGTVYPLRPPCFAMAYKVRKGQKLRLRVTTSDDDKLPFFATDPNVTVAFGGSDGTQLTLPEVVDGRLYTDSIDVGDTAGDASSSG
jgi:X-Pro dipeptidyl-peptidase